LYWQDQPGTHYFFKKYYKKKYSRIYWNFQKNLEFPEFPGISKFNGNFKIFMDPG